jgi:hypothetical protein
MKTKGLVHSLFLSTVLAVGFAAVWGVIGVWALEVGTHVVAEATPNSVVLVPRAMLMFLPDGMPVVSHQDGRRRQLRDLRGNPVEEPDNEHPFLRLVQLSAHSTTDDTGQEVSWDLRIKSFADGHLPVGYWYFISDGRRDGTGYFVGYDSETRTCLGYLGTAGLREVPLPAEELIPYGGAAAGPNSRLLSTQRDQSPTEHPRRRSPGHAPRGSVSSWDVYVLGRDGKLYHADLQKRTIQIAFSRSPILSAMLAGGLPDAIHGTPYRPAVRTEDAVLILDERGEVLKRYPIPDSLRGLDISFGETNTSGAVMCWKSPEDIFASEVQYRICRMDEDGKSQEWATTLPFVETGRLIPLAGLVIPSPVGLAGAVMAWRPSMLLDDGLAASYPEALTRALIEFWPTLALAQLVALCFAMFCYRRQVRFGAGRGERIVWPVFVLLLGFPGWIGYRFSRRWPVLEKCEDCGGVVPRDRMACARCEATFSRPSLKGIEVFA